MAARSDRPLSRGRAAAPDGQREPTGTRTGRLCAGARLRGRGARAGQRRVSARRHGRRMEDVDGVHLLAVTNDDHPRVVHGVPPREALRRELQGVPGGVPLDLSRGAPQPRPDGRGVGVPRRDGHHGHVRVEGHAPPGPRSLLGRGARVLGGERGCRGNRRGRHGRVHGGRGRGRGRVRGGRDRGRRCIHGGRDSRRGRVHGGRSRGRSRVRGGRGHGRGPPQRPVRQEGREVLVAQGEGVVPEEAVAVAVVLQGAVVVEAHLQRLDVGVPPETARARAVAPGGRRRRGGRRARQCREARPLERRCDRHGRGRRRAGVARARLRERAHLFMVALCVCGRHFDATLERKSVWLALAHRRLWFVMRGACVLREVVWWERRKSVDDRRSDRAEDVASCHAVSGVIIM